MPGRSTILRTSAVVGVLVLAFHLAHGQFGLGGRGLNRFTYDWLYDGVILGAAISCLARAWLVRTERLPWLLLGIGLAFNASGEIYYSLVFGDSGNPPIPSFDDLLYLLYYPAAYAAFVLLVRGQTEQFSASNWLDGAIAAATSAAVIAAIAFEPIVHNATHANAATIATTLAYPVGDLILLAIVAGVFGLSGWRPQRAWLFLGIGLGLSAIADTGYAYTNANGTYSVGGILDSLWLAAALFSASAPWQSGGGSRRLRLEGTRVLVIPGAFALLSLAVLLYGGFHRVGPLALALAGAAMLLVIGRAAWTFRENIRLLEISRQDAVTDALTGLGNRRRMFAELERALVPGRAAEPAVLALFDLDGFKLYNDRFGHLAGDTMLAHLGRRLQAAVAETGSAYRVGGDEFCVLLHCDAARAARHIAAAVAALSAKGEGFSVGSSHGQVEIPSEAHTTTHALRLADRRMYAEKNGRRGSARQQTHDVLLGLLRERQPELHDHLREVGRLAVIVGRSLAMSEEELDELRRAAELHDIGKAAIPDSILNKPGPLSDDEWAFMRRHTLVGERILAAAPALTPVAKLVRSSHERWDGKGYPDHLAGQAIPLGARIVCVCDAFDAMTSGRAYSRPLSAGRALEELGRYSGSQFDPEVVDAFVLAWHKAMADAEAPVQLAQPAA